MGLSSHTSLDVVLACPIPDLDRRPAYRLTQAQAADLLGVTAGTAALGSARPWATKHFGHIEERREYAKA